MQGINHNKTNQNTDWCKVARQMQQRNQQKQLQQAANYHNSKGAPSITSNPGTISQAPSNYEKMWSSTTAPDMQSYIKSDPVIKSVATGGAASMAVIGAIEAGPTLLSKTVDALSNPVNIGATIGDVVNQSANQVLNGESVDPTKWNLASIGTNALGAYSLVQGYTSGLVNISIDGGVQTNFTLNGVIDGTINSLGNKVAGQGTNSLTPSASSVGNTSKTMTSAILNFWNNFTTTKVEEEIKK